MKNLCNFIKSLPSVDCAAEYGVYSKSVNSVGDSFAFMVKEPEADFLVVTGTASNGFEGEEKNENGISYKVCPLSNNNGVSLRKLFPFTAPVPVLQNRRTAGVGDRLGIACPGHIRVFNDYDAFPILAQQSIRELNLTNRTYADVLDAASFTVFRDGFKRGFGADGDHLKHEDEIEYALSLGYTMITLDCSEHIKNGIDRLSAEEVSAKCSLPAEIESLYLNKTFEVEGEKLTFDKEALERIMLIYGEAVEFAIGIYDKYFVKGKARANFEISIDETETPTTPLQHYFVANELTRHGVKVDTMAPRFCGEFQKGVDYIGDLKQFEAEMKIHAAIARCFGYKLSIHSGSDKFSTFEIIGKYTQGNFHLKTAGTNWLEAMRAVATTDPSLYREIHKFALGAFADAKRFYHVTTDLTKIPDVDSLKDSELPGLFAQNDARQLIHITYGHILTAKDDNGNFLFKDRLYSLWRKEADVYSDMIYKHIGHHLELLYKGFCD